MSPPKTHPNFVAKKIAMNTIPLKTTFNNGGIIAENLRPNRNANGDLTFTQTPRPVAHITDSKPLIILGRNTILANGTTLSIVHPDGSITPGTSLPATPLCAFNNGDDAIIMTSQGAFRLCLDDDTLTATPLRSKYPDISLCAIDAGPIQASVAARQLSQSYNGGTLTSRDTDTITSDIVNAYLAITSQASAGGLLLQPVIARYRLRADDGTLLFTSAPVLLCHPDGAQCANAIKLYTDDRQTVNAYTLKLSAWQLQAHIPSAATDVATMEIYMTPPFHPYRSNAPATASIARITNTNDPFIYATLPGAHRAISSGNSFAAELTLRSTIARLDDIESCVSIITDPFGSNAGTIDIAIASDGDAASVGTTLDSALKTRVTAANYRDVMLAQPHSFTANVSASGSGVIAWGDIVVQRYIGHGAAAFAADSSDKPWNATIRVRFADGSVAIRSDSYTSGAPSKFHPILSYPAPDAVEMTIVAFYGNANHRLSVALKPDISRRCAVYINPNLKPFTLPEASSAQIIDGTFRTIPMPDIIAFADSASPLTICTRTDIASAPRFIVHPGGAQLAWEYGRTRFIAISDSEISSCAVNMSAHTATSRCLFAHHGNASPCACCGAPGEVFASFGNDIYIINNSRATNIKTLDSCRGLGYDATRDELWCLDSDGHARILCRKYNWSEYLATAYVYHSFSHPSELFHALGNGFYTIPGTDSEPSDEHIALYIPDISAPHAWRQIVEILTACKASHFAGDITITTAYEFHSKPLLLRKASFNGTITAPIAMRIISRDVRCCAVEINATATNFSLSAIGITTNTPSR